MIRTERVSAVPNRTQEIAFYSCQKWGRVAGVSTIVMAELTLYATSEGWSSAENAALVEYVLCYGDPHMWPNYSSKEFFFGRSCHNHRCPGSIKRTGIYLAEDIFSLYHFFGSHISSIFYKLLLAGSRLTTIFFTNIC